MEKRTVNYNPNYILEVSWYKNLHYTVHFTYVCMYVYM